MPATRNAKTTVISSISPAFVEQGWEGLVKIHGNGFDRYSFAKFNDATPEVVDQSDSLLVVEIHPDLTANPGRISVQVHTIESGTSNEIPFVVKPKSR